VLFLTTANVIDPIPPALRDRMEVLELAGYTEEEKLAIAFEHLIAKQVKNHGLTPEYVEFTKDAISNVIRGYTREAGVRNLEREIGALCRKVARRRARGTRPGGDHPRAVVQMLGAPTFPRRRVENRTKDPGSRSAWPGRRRAASAVRRSLAHAGGRVADADRTSRRRHEGIGAHALSWFRATRSATASIPRSTRTPRSTCTCRPARCRRTARRPA
jgi:hypothetical protein